MTWLLYLLGILAAAVGIAVSIGLHEIGHMVPAKRFGVRVTQYMIGFGPTIWSRRGRETEYGVKAIPLGGYIRMIGMFPPPQGAPEGTAKGGNTGRFAMLAEDARRASLEEIPPGQEHRVFHRLSARRKVIVMMGGPTMNLLISVFVFSVLLMGIGLPRAGTTIESVYPCIPPQLTSEAAAQQALAERTPASECTPSDVPAPGALAGLQQGVQVTGVDDVGVDDWSDLTEYTRARPGQRVELTTTGPGGTRTDAVVLATVWRPVFDDEGRATGDVEPTGFIGVVPQTIYEAQPPSAVVTAMWDLTERSVQALVRLPIRVAELAGDMIAGEPRDPEGPVSVVGISRISGEVAAAQDPVLDKVVTLLSLLAGLNLFLFLFNLVPILPLDGGHVAGALYEGTRRHLARWRGRPDPGPVDVSKAMPVAYAVAVVMIAMSSIVILADIIKPLSLNG